MSNDLLQEFVALQEAAIKGNSKPEVLERFKNFEQILLQSVLINLSDTIKDLVATASSSFSASVEIKFDHKLFPVFISEDVTQSFSEALVHLLRNSVSHGQSKDGSVRIKTEYAFCDQEWGLKWEDGGSSLLQDIELESLFKSKSEKPLTLVSGRGVGLSAAKKALKNHDIELKLYRTGIGGLGVFLPFPKGVMGFSGQFIKNFFYISKESTEGIKKAIFFPVQGNEFLKIEGAIPWACVEDGKLIVARLPV